MIEHRTLHRLDGILLHVTRSTTFVQRASSANRYATLNSLWPASGIFRARACVCVRQKSFFGSFIFQIRTSSAMVQVWADTLSLRCLTTLLNLTFERDLVRVPAKASLLVLVNHIIVVSIKEPVPEGSHIGMRECHLSLQTGVSSHHSYLVVCPRSSICL